MADEKTRKECPQCCGEKVIAGVCECSSEWRGTESDDGWDDCQCTPEITCPACGGKGYVEE